MNHPPRHARIPCSQEQGDLGPSSVAMTGDLQCRACNRPVRLAGFAPFGRFSFPLRLAPT